MLIIPFDRPLDWRHPPAVTLLLILINTLCFAFWQGGEDAAMEDAMGYYASSGLLETEYPLFEQYLSEKKGLHKPIPPLDKARQAPEYLYFAMLREPDFARKAKAGTLIPQQDEAYADWAANRRTLSQKLSKVTFLEYGLKTASPTWQSLLAHMFLHADFMHLFGNMFFLLAVGLLVEGVLGSRTYLLCYLVAGLGSTSLDFLFTPDQFIPGIGASGAIAGVMGMLTVLYWTRPVRFFYFLFVYFDFIRLPAIVLLPLWVGNELFQLFSQPYSNINFLAHLGGLGSGALIGWIVRRTPAFQMERLEQQDREKEFQTRLAGAYELLRNQDYKAALPLLRKLNKEHPENLQLLFNLYDAEKIYPASEEYHQISLGIFELRARDAQTAGRIHETFQNYMMKAQPKPRLNKRILCRLIGTFDRCGKQNDVDKLAQILAKKRVRCAEQLAVLQQIHDTALRNGELQRTKIYRALLDAQAE